MKQMSKKRKALWHKHRDYVHDEVFRMVKKANRGLEPERQVSFAIALEVANRALKKNRNPYSAARAFAALRAVSSFISMATSGTETIGAAENFDLLPVGHPLSTRQHGMTASALQHARARWFAADPAVDELVRPLVAAAHAAAHGTDERTYMFERLAAVAADMAPLWLRLDDPITVFGPLSFIGGNSSAARRARAQLQRRDRRGRFAEMGGGWSFNLRGADGLFSTVSGRVVGSSGDGDAIEVEVVGDPDLPNGIYTMPSSKGEAVKAILPEELVKGLPKRKAAAGDDVFVGLDEVKATRKNSPTGWKFSGRIKRATGDTTFYESEDGYEVSVTPNADGTNTFKLRRKEKTEGENFAESYDSWGDVQKAALADQDNYEKALEQAAKQKAAPKAEVPAQAEVPVTTAQGGNDIDVTDSSALQRMTYDPDTQELFVEFKSLNGKGGGKYIYDGVDQDMVDKFVAAESKGKLIPELKRGYEARKLSDDEAQRWLDDLSGAQRVTAKPMQAPQLPVRGEGESLSWETSERSGFVFADGANADTHYLIRPDSDGGYSVVESAKTKAGTDRQLGRSDTLDGAKQLAQEAENARVESDKAREFVDISDLINEYTKMRGEDGKNGEPAATWLKDKLREVNDKVVVFDYKGKRRAVDIDIAGYYESKFARKEGRGAKLIGFDRESGGNREFFFTEMKPVTPAEVSTPSAPDAEPGAPSPGIPDFLEAEFDELFDTPNGAYKPNIFDLYTPFGRTDQDSTDYTDDPSVLQAKFSQEELAGALRNAVLPSVDGPADGQGVLEFDRGDELVPAEALYEALQLGGLDADMVLGGIYDSGLDPDRDNGTNIERLRERRESEDLAPGEEPKLVPLTDRTRAVEEAIKRNEAVAAPTRAQRGVDLLNEYDEKNESIKSLAKKLNELQDTDDSYDDEGLQDLLEEYLPWSRSENGDEREAFRSLWGLFMSLDGGASNDQPSPEEIADMGFRGRVMRALDEAFPGEDFEDTYPNLLEEYGGYPEFVDGRNAIADGQADLDAPTTAAAFYRLTKEAARPTTVEVQRSIGVRPDDPLFVTYTTPGSVFAMDPRSFTTNNLADAKGLEALQFAPGSDFAHVIFRVAPGDADTFSAIPFSWFPGEQEHIGWGTYEVTDVRTLDNPLRKNQPKVEVTIRKTDRQPSEPTEESIFEDTTTDVSNWAKVGEQAGSNVGGFFEDEDGNQYYVKVPKSQKHAENEVLAAKFYERLGVPAAEVRLGEDNGETRIVSPLIPGATSDLGERLYDKVFLEKLRDGFVVDAWLANWDVAGLVYDNVMTDEDGNPVRVDPGGALMYRARGAEKGPAFGDVVGELDTLRDPDLNPQNSQIFRGITDAELNDQAARLRRLEPEEINAIVDSVITDPEMASTLKQRLRARRENILMRYPGDQDSADVFSERTPLTDAMTREVSELQRGDILAEDSFVVEQVFTDDGTPDGKISVQGYYPGHQSQRKEYDPRRLVEASRGGTIPPKGDRDPLHKPEPPRNMNNPAEVAAYRDELAQYEMAKAVAAIWSCGGAGLTAAVGGNGPCTVQSLDELIDNVNADPSPADPVEVPEADGVDITQGEGAEALLREFGEVEASLQVLEEDEDLKPSVKKKAQEIVDSVNSVRDRLNSGELTQDEALAELNDLISSTDRANVDIDFMISTVESVRNVLDGSAFAEKVDPNLPPPGAVHPKTGKPVGFAKDGVTKVVPGMLVRDKDGFAGTVDRYNKSDWVGVYVINAIDGQKYMKASNQLTPINPGDDDRAYVEPPGGYSGQAKMRTIVPDGTVETPFSGWNDKARTKHEEAFGPRQESAEVPKAEAPSGAPEAAETQEAPSGENLDDAIVVTEQGPADPLTEAQRATVSKAKPIQDPGKFLSKLDENYWNKSNKLKSFFIKEEEKNYAGQARSQYDIDGATYYMQGGAEEYNRWLAGLPLPEDAPKRTEEKYIKSIKTLDKVLQLSPKVGEDIIVYRGVRARSSDQELVQALEKLQPGDEFTSPTFTSTSIIKSVAEEFSGKNGVFLEIVVPKGSSGLFVDPIMSGGEYEDTYNLPIDKLAKEIEAEFVLPRNVIFKVLSRDGNNIKLLAVEGEYEEPKRIERLEAGSSDVAEPAPEPDVETPSTEEAVPYKEYKDLPKGEQSDVDIIMDELLAAQAVLDVAYSDKDLSAPKTGNEQDVVDLQPDTPADLMNLLIDELAEGKLKLEDISARFKDVVDLHDAWARQNPDKFHKIIGSSNATGVMWKLKDAESTIGDTIESMPTEFLDQQYRIARGDVNFEGYGSPDVIVDVAKQLEYSGVPEFARIFKSSPSSWRPGASSANDITEQDVIPRYLGHLYARKLILDGKFEDDSSVASVAQLYETFKNLEVLKKKTGSWGYEYIRSLDEALNGFKNSARTNEKFGQELQSILANKAPGTGVPAPTDVENLPWDKSGLTNIPSLVSAVEASRSRRGKVFSFAADSGDIEDLTVDVVTAKNTPASKKSSTRYSFKLTSWAAENLSTKIDLFGDFEKQATLNIPTLAKKSGEEPSLSIKKMKSSSENSFTYVFDDKIDGVPVKINFVRADGSGKNYSGKAFNSLVSITVPEGTDTSVVEKAMRISGVRDTRPATDVDAKTWIENRIISVFGGYTDASTNISNPTLRATILDGVKNRFGLNPDDVEVVVGADNRIEMRVPPEVAKKVKSVTGVEFFRHRLWTEHDERVKKLYGQEKTDMIVKIISDMFTDDAGTSGTLLSTTNRYYRGMKDVAGMSQNEDIRTGGADYIFTTPVSGDYGLYGGSSHSLAFYYEPEILLRRIDFYSNTFDNYGARDETKDVIADTQPGSHETIFKGGIGPEALRYILVGNKAFKEQLLQALRDRGVTEIGGRPIEDVVTYGLSREANDAKLKESAGG